MMQRAFFSAFATVLLSAVLVQTAAAYPTTATSARATVTGSYRPLDLNLDTLVDGTDALSYTVSGGPLVFVVDLTGTFTGDGYAVSGQAGTWRLSFSDTLSAGVTSNDDDPSIYMFSTGAGLRVGTLRYLGGLSVDSGILLAADTPEIGDIFELFTTTAGSSTVLQIVCSDGVLTCNDFDLTLSQDLQHIGPYQPGTEFLVLDEERLNESCISGNSVVPCGLVTGLVASSVPEPATLALLGLGLAGLGLSRRARP